MTTPLHLADDLLARGDAARAVAVVEQAATAGDGEALFRLAAWRLIGTPLPRDLPAARSLLRQAVTAGHHDAMLLQIALTANGSGGAQDWLGARKLLAEAATYVPAAAEQLALLNGMKLDDAGRPVALPAPEPLASGGRIIRYPKLLTPAECAQIAKASADLLSPTEVVDPKTGRSVPHPIRTSDGAVIGPMRENLVIRALNLRIAQASGTLVDQGEALTVLRYRPGQQFRMHSDALPPHSTRNQRAVTVLVYLNEGFAGGDTVFPDHGVSVRPQIGDAVIFRNLLDDGSPDSQARHAGEVVRQGVKWLATRWIRQRPFSQWTGPDAA